MQLIICAKDPIQYVPETFQLCLKLEENVT